MLGQRKTPAPCYKTAGKMQTPANIVVDKGACLANGSTILPVKTFTGPLAWMSENYLRVLWNSPTPGGPRPKARHFENLEGEVQRQIPSQPLPNGKYLTGYDLKEKLCSCLQPAQRGAEYLKVKIDFGKARFLEDFQPTKATPEELENRTMRVVVRVGWSGWRPPKWACPWKFPASCAET